MNSKAEGDTPAPFIWDEERRAHLRAELAYILDTFPIVRRKDEERWGEYRTRRMALEAWEKTEAIDVVYSK